MGDLAPNFLDPGFQRGFRKIDGNALFEWYEKALNPR
jgi:hypothetical protein